MPEVLVPMTSQEISNERRKAFHQIAGVATFFVATHALARLIPSWGDALFFVALVFFAGLPIAAIPTWISTFKLNKPLNGVDCIRLQALCAEHSEIATMVSHVRELGRPVAYADLWTANGWLYKQTLLLQRQACRDLNGIAG